MGATRDGRSAFERGHPQEPAEKQQKRTSVESLAAILVDFVVERKGLVHIHFAAWHVIAMGLQKLN